MTESIAGINIPDTKLVGDATELVRQAASGPGDDTCLLAP
jgi:hypothetical protein